MQARARRGESGPCNYGVIFRSGNKLRPRCFLSFLEDNLCHARRHLGYSDESSRKAGILKVFLKKQRPANRTSPTPGGYQ